MTKPFLILGNPENRRVTMFEEALARQGQRRARVLRWIDLAAGPERVEALFDELPEEPHLVRIDSFGEDFAVEVALLLRGWERLRRDPKSGERAVTVPPDEARSTPNDHGRIWAPRQAHLGFLEVLDDVRRALENRPWLEVLNEPASIARLFDKRACAETFAAASVPIAKPLPGAASIRTPEELRAQMMEHGMHRVFVKLTSGSSASCLALYAFDQQRPTWLFTSMEIDGDRLYNSLRPRRYRDPRSIDRVLSFLLDEGSHIEEEVPKARLGDRWFDTRMVTVRRPRAVTADDADVAFTVVRTSPHPVTNLHLGGTRGSLDELTQTLPSDVLARAHESCRRVFAAHRCLHLGVDVMFTADLADHRVLEANAFGDLLPNLERDGLSVHEWEIRAALAGSSIPSP